MEGGNGKLHFSDFEFLYRHRDEDRYSKWFDLTEVASSSPCPIYHFYAGKCEADIKQVNETLGLINVFTFAMNEKKHGSAV